jgi:hypothetical protein
MLEELEVVQGRLAHLMGIGQAEVEVGLMMLPQAEVAEMAYRG